MRSLCSSRPSSCDSGDTSLGKHSSLHPFSQTKENRLPLACYEPSTTTTFTVIRDPLEHFISGWGQVAKSQNMLQSVTCSDAEKFVTDLIYGKGRHWWAYFHAFPQSAYLWQALYNIDYVGRLDTLISDWATHTKVPWLRHAPLSREVGQHTNHSSAVTAMLSLLKRMPHFLRAVCKLIEVDYACFGYHPETCRVTI